MTQFKQISDPIGAIILASDGQVQFMTQRAEQLLSQYSLPHAPHSLPDPLHYWLKHQIAKLTYNSNVLSSNLYEVVFDRIICSEVSPVATSIPNKTNYGNFVFTLHIEQAGQQLIIRLIPDPTKEQYLLLLEEQKLPSFSIAALELLGLSKREAEVLFWVAKDKSNAGIARVLGCCEGTVRKHLEHLYKKLGVQTRTGAVMVALEKLGLLKGEFVAMSS